MPTLIFGILALVLLLWALNVFSKVDPKKLVGILKPAGEIAALIGAAVLAVRGQFGLALPLGFAGLGLLGLLPGPAGWTARTAKTPGQTSRVRSAFVEMELDHDTGAMQGRILAGRYEGVGLEALDIATIITVLGEVDEDSRALLAAYLDRRQPRWREDLQGDAAAWEGSPAWSGKMTKEEAYQILGVPAGASVDEITRAHRTLMKKLHPDQGGSTYLAARVNAAKDILLQRHR